MRIPGALATSLGALALALAPAALAAPAAAAEPGYHASYFSESSFLSLSPGQTGQFAVGFSNTGDQGWVKGTTAQASLHTAAPLDNTTDFTAGWSVSWTSGSVYALQSTDLVAPSQIGFFVYNVKVPAGTALGAHTFYGRPAVESAGFLEDYGYYQIVTVTTSALTITGSVPASPSTTTTPVLSGTGAPAGATVTIKEGTTTLCTATATSTGTFTCGSSALGAGGHSLVASAPGVGDSPAFGYTVDTSAPAVSSASASNTATVVVNYSKAMKCTTDGALASIATAGNYAITTSPGGAAVAETITVTAASGCSQATLVLSNPLTNAAAYTVTVSNVQDSLGNLVGTTRTATFTVTDSGVPTASAVQSGAAVVTVTYSKAMNTATTGALATYKLDSVSCTSLCSGVTTTSTGAVITFTTAPTVGTHVLDITGATDSAGNLISPNPTSISISFTASTSRPTVTGASATNSAKVNVTFSTSMDPTTAQTAANYTIQKADGTPYSSLGSATCSPSTGSCTSVDLVPNTSLISASYNVVVTAVKDTFNNIVNPNPTIRGPFAFTLDTSPPSVTSISASQTAIGTASLAITYSKAMKSVVACGGSGAATAGSGVNIDNKGDYGVALGGSGQPDPTTLNAALGASTTVAISADCRSATFTLSGNFTAGTYLLTYATAQDQAGNQITATSQTFVFVDTVQPTIAAGTWLSATQFKVTYSKAMKGGSSISNSAGNIANYNVNNGAYGSLCASGGTPTITANAGLTEWTITCAGANGIWGLANANTVFVQNVVDNSTSANIITPNPRSQVF